MRNRSATATLLPVEFSPERLFEHAALGDREALEQLLRRYLPQLHAYVHVRLGPHLRQHESSLDVVQSVCSELVNFRGRFDFDSEDRFRAWLFTAALNKLRDHHRHLHRGKRDVGRLRPATDLEVATAVAHMLTPSQEAIGNETAVAVGEALAALSEEHREVITLTRIVRLPHSVAAEVLSRSEAATRQLLARAMVQLVRELHRRGVEVTDLNPN